MLSWNQFSSKTLNCFHLTSAQSKAKKRGYFLSFILNFLSALCGESPCLGENITKRKRKVNFLSDIYKPSYLKITSIVDWCSLFHHLLPAPGVQGASPCTPCGAGLRLASWGTGCFVDWAGKGIPPHSAESRLETWGMVSSRPMLPALIAPNVSRTMVYHPFRGV